MQSLDESTFNHHKTSCRTLKFSADGSGMAERCCGGVTLRATDRHSLLLLHIAVLHPYIHLSVHLSIHTFICPPPIYLSVHLSIHASICLSIHPSIQASSIPSILISIILSVYLPSRPCINVSRPGQWQHCADMHTTLSPSHPVLYSGSKVGDIAFCDVPSGKLRQLVKGAHSAPLYSMHRLGERMVATGDDAGWIKVIHISHSLIAMITANVSSGKGLHMIMYSS